MMEQIADRESSEGPGHLQGLWQDVTGARIGAMKQISWEQASDHGQLDFPFIVFRMASSYSFGQKSAAGLRQQCRGLEAFSRLHAFEDFNLDCFGIKARIQGSHYSKSPLPRNVAERVCFVNCQV